jgi:hypothetical protein
VFRRRHARATANEAVVLLAAVRATLDEVLTLSEHVHAHIDADREERRALTASLERLAHALERPPLPAEPAVKVIGGSFFGLGANVLEGATGAEAAPDDTIIDVRDHVVEVRCRFGDRWVDGFEVCELVPDGDRIRYRLRRQVDGSVLPTLFDADDVRENRGGASEEPVLTSPRRRWLYR